MGLLEPARRPLPLPREGRALAVAELPTLDDLDVAGKRVLDPCGPERPARRRTDHRRLPHPRVPADARAHPRARRDGRRVLAPRTPEGPRREVHARAASRRRCPRRSPATCRSSFDYEKVPDARVVAAREPALQRGRDEERSGLREALGSLADAYVNDAFGVVPPRARVDRRTAGVLPSCSGPPAAARDRAPLGAAGRPEASVRRRRSAARRSPTRSASCSNLLDKADRILIGGGMCFTFLKARGGRSATRSSTTDAFDDVVAIVGQREAARCRPTSSSPTRSMPTEAATSCAADEIPDGKLGIDIGPDSARGVRERDPRRRRPCSGTARWACSRSRRSRTARASSRDAVASTQGVHRDRRRRRRPPRSRTSDWRTRLTSHRRAGEPRSSSSKAKTLPGIAALTKE